MSKLDVATAIEGARQAGTDFLKYRDELWAVSTNAGADAGLAEYICRAVLVAAASHEANSIHFIAQLAGATPEEANAIRSAFDEGLFFAKANSPEGRA